MNDDQLSHIYQQSRSQEPPMALDDAILNKARKALQQESETSDRKVLWSWTAWVRSGWIIPLTSTAIVLLSASLIIQMQQEHLEMAHSDLIQQEKIMQKSLPQQIAPIQENGITFEQQTILDRAESESALSVQSSAKKKALLPKQPRALASPAAFKATQSTRKTTVSPTALDFDDAQHLQAPPKILASPADSMHPQAWLKHIRALIQLGEIAAAQKSLQTFKKGHPDYQLPKDIIAALKSAAR